MNETDTQLTWLEVMKELSVGVGFVESGVLNDTFLIK